VKDKGMNPSICPQMNAVNT